jgi:hypothetical protein
MTLTEKPTGISRRAMLLSAATIPAFAGIGQIATAERVDAAENLSAKDAALKNAVDAYVYFYPLVVFGVTMEVLTNVERPTWEKLSAPLNQLMSVRYDRPANHGVIVPSTDTLYSAVLADVTKEPLVLGVPAIPDIPGTNRKRFMMYQFIDAWSNVFFSSGLRQNQVKKTNFIIVGPDFRGSLPDIPDGLLVQAPTNQSWLALRTQVESANDLDNVHAIQDLYTATPLSMYGKQYEAPPGVVNPNIPTDRGPSPQANALNGQQFFTKAAEWFNKVPFPAADIAVGMETVLEQVGIKHGQPFDYASLSPEVKNALELATQGVQQEFTKLEENPAAIGGLKNGWVIPSPATGNFGTNYRLRAAIAFVGFGANLTADALYPLLVQDSNGKVLDGGKKYRITFLKGELPPAGAFWSVTNYQDHFLVLNSANKYSVSSWMNPKIASDGSLTIYLQPTSPGSDLEINWLPSSPSIPGVTPLMRLYWPLPPALEGGKWSPPPAVEVT